MTLDIFRLNIYHFFIILKFKILYVFILLQLIIPCALLALEPAPDITDREVMEKLTKLEAGQQALRSEMKAGQQALRSEMKAGQQALNQRISDLRSEMKAGQETLNKRFDDLNQRISETNYIMITIFGAVIVMVTALFGYILWDRRTMIKPVLERIERIEQDVDLSNAFGSKLSHLISAMRELAKTDEQLATVLRSFSLL